MSKKYRKGLYDFCKDDYDFIELFKSYNDGNERGYKTAIKDSIRFFVDNLNIYLDKPYIDVSYLQMDDKLIDLDLLHDVFKNDLIERMDS